MITFPWFTMNFISIQLLRDNERRVWWWKEQDFIRPNKLRGAEGKEPTKEELRIKYKNDWSKPTRYIPIDMYADWLESKMELVNC